MTDCYSIPMKNLELSVKREIDFMIKYQLTADELFLIRMIFYAQDGHDEFMKSYFSQCQLGKSIRDLLFSLQEKGIINKSYKVPETGTKFNPEDVDFNKLVIKSYMEHSGTLGMELFDSYPPYTMINGRYFSLKNISKQYSSLDDMCWDYGHAIKFNPSVHAEVMDLLEYGKDNNLITNGLVDFVISHQWDLLRQYRNGDMGTFKTTELV